MKKVSDEEKGGVFLVLILLGVAGGVSGWAGVALMILGLVFGFMLTVSLRADR